MIETPKIVFMGTPEFAVGILQKLVNENINIVGVVTAPDKAAGRGRKMQSSAVKDYAVTQNLKLLQPTNLKEETFLTELAGLEANLLVVVAFRMLPKVVWAMPKMGTINLHASLLPDYRGAAPINWAVINQEKKTGVTTFFIDDKIDTGAIILKQEVPLSQNETAGSLYHKLLEAGKELIIKTIGLIEIGNINTLKQNLEGNFKEAPKLTPENTRIYWNEDGGKIDAFIRGLSPYPVAWTIYTDEGRELKMKIYSAHFKSDNQDLPFGTLVVQDKVLKVAVNNGFIYIDELQLPGKRKMKIKDLLNGHTFPVGSKVM